MNVATAPHWAVDTDATMASALSGSAVTANLTILVQGSGFKVEP
jgi:hypothetical protein